MNKISSFEEYQKNYKESISKPDNFWSKIADSYTWKKKWDKVLDFDFNKAKIDWFVNAELNITENLLDRHLEERGNKLALIWEPNNPNEKSIRYTYKELHKAVCHYANVLKNNGVEKGDRVCIYLPMIPELTIITLACARIGAIHSVVFAGFSANSLADRINDSGCKLIITSDGQYRGTKEIPLKSIVDEAIEQCNTIEKVLVVLRLGWIPNMKKGRDFWMQDELSKVGKECPAVTIRSDDPLFILYTSGSTGKPKGIVHHCGGYMVSAGYTFKNVFQVDESDTYWCTADVGWITGHTYVIYGPLLNGSTTVMFEGIPTYPDAGRFWEIIDKFEINQFYTAPTAIRSLMKQGLDHVLPYSLSSLKVLGSVGEPINEEAWEWFHTHIGKEKCSIVDTWWQTETGSIMISGLGNHSPMKPCHAGYPLPGVQPVLLNKDGHEITEPNIEGYLTIKYPWPSISCGIYDDQERFYQTYFSNFEGYYFSGDSAKRDENGMFRIIGRVDDVINVSGHRFGTAEIENGINQSHNVVESAVVGYPHEIKGEGIFAFVICKEIPKNTAEEIGKIIESVVKEIGKIAKPDKILIVDSLPKTRSGKIMRRILRKIAHGEVSDFGDTSTLLDSKVIDKILNEIKNDVILLSKLTS